MNELPTWKTESPGGLVRQRSRESRDFYLWGGFQHSVALERRRSSGRLNIFRQFEPLWDANRSIRKINGCMATPISDGSPKKNAGRNTRLIWEHAGRNHCSTRKIETSLRDFINFGLRDPRERNSNIVGFKGSLLTSPAIRKFENATSQELRFTVEFTDGGRGFRRCLQLSICARSLVFHAIRG